jgi:hypothetical protein
MRFITVATILALFALSGCAAYLAVDETDTPAYATAETIGVPPGHLPAPGECRVWVPGTPPGRQSAPGECATLAHRVPPGAMLLYRPANEPDRLDVTYFDGQGLMASMRSYDIRGSKGAVSAR